MGLLLFSYGRPLQTRRWVYLSTFNRVADKSALTWLECMPPVTATLPQLAQGLADHLSRPPERDC